MSVAQGQPHQRASGGRDLLDFGACTDRAGREVNEDNCTTEADRRNGRDHLGTLFALADGMGGGEAGKRASLLAISAIGEGYFESGSESPMLSLQRAVDQANSTIYAFTVNARKAGVVGSTIVAAAVVGSRAYIVNVGDSRAYHVHGGQAQQITTDHNWANQQIQLGRMTPEQASAHENAPLLTHVLGQGASLQIPLGGQPDGQFSFVVELQPGEAIVLCSDGVTGVVPPQELAALAISAAAPQAAAQIVARAKARRTTDNATAVVLRYGAGIGRAGGGLPPWLLPVGGGVAALVALLAVVMFAFAGAGGGGTTQTRGTSAPTGGSAGVPLSSTAPPEEPTLLPGAPTRQSTSTSLPATPTSSPTNTPKPQPTQVPVQATKRPAQPAPPKVTPLVVPPTIGAATPITTTVGGPPTVGQPADGPTPTATPMDVPTQNLPPTDGPPPTTVPPTDGPPPAVPPTDVPQPTPVPPTEKPHSGGGGGGGGGGHNPEP